MKNWEYTVLECIALYFIATVVRVWDMRTAQYWEFLALTITFGLLNFYEGKSC